ncbi:hypothetical protein [Nitrosarchaeum koreense]|uniref:Uncharacterized protein n=1 Tax=Nitrosarchaeum koreense MY1 TaxID=1001994 RepID=F9CYP5_9ARCH|nr:hypothetical protein [Nitrosarchaeum koreense]EGP94439.1 hypothetical protein MY1_1692 [Nitrosarchaeum koreense MY1]
MKFSDEQIQDIIAMRDNIVKQMDKHQNAIETLQKNLAILDSILKESSFTKASAIKQVKTSESSKNIPIEPTEKLEKSTIPITSGSDGKIIANAYITPDQVSIILAENMEINADTPPFKSFFIDRIIGEMKRKDSAEAENGKIQKESVIDYIINKNGSDIREIIIKNYRQKERVNEIINTAGWSLTRMLEKIKK